MCWYVQYIVIITYSFVLIKDIDECANMTLASLCSQRCINNIGSYECQCNSGYELAGDKRTCNGKCYKIWTIIFLNFNISFIFFSYTDVDECSRFLHDCQQICVNTLGSYNCSCNDGFILQNDTQSCVGKKTVFSLCILHLFIDHS